MPFFRESIVPTWDLSTFEDLVHNQIEGATIVPTWDLSTFED